MNHPGGRTFCPGCGADNELSSSFCFSCGSHLDTDPVEATSPRIRPAPVVPGPIGPPMVEPPHPPPWATAAPTVQRPAPNPGPEWPTPTPQPPAGPQRRTALLLGVVALVVVLAGAGIGYVLLSGDDGRTSASSTSAAPGTRLVESPGASDVFSPPIDTLEPTDSAPPSVPETTPTPAGLAPGSMTVVGGDGVTYPVHIYAVDRITNCATHAYGAAARSFLRQHPCRNAHRLLSTVSVDGRRAVLSVITVSFDPGLDGVNVDFQDLENAPGTGGMNDLLREGRTVPGQARRIPSTEAFVVTGGDTQTVIFDAWWASGHTDDQDSALVNMEDAMYGTELTPFD